VPEEPAVFTKFPSCIAGPTSEIPVGSETVDWEVELVVALGRTAHRVPVERTWDHVAGLMVGQDISDRAVQRRPPAQWSLAKSFTGFGPTGPFLVTVDDVPDRDDLELGCSVNGEEVQKARTSDLIFPVPELVSRLSHIVTLWPGDLIFTGTPSGVGYARTPPRFLHPGDLLTSYIEGVGELRNRCVAS
jgi:2,4-didehydro-3-deoxy-L-rhamnonate hydrolase